ncbi:MAG: heat-inducible transcriptional repressor HrcA, partial [Pseudomonadota bacterium]
MPEPTASLSDLNARSRDVFRRLVETYLDTGEPVGSRTLSRALPDPLSPATIRNTMQDLELLGLLDSPHVSAGRVPTQRGLRLFVDGLLEIGDVAGEERAEIERALRGNDTDMGEVLDRAGRLLSGLTATASLVLAPKADTAIRHLEIVALSPERALVVLVMSDGHVENRVFTPPPGLTPSAMREAANFLSTILEGRTLADMRAVVAREVEARRQELDTLAASLVEAGVAVWAGGEPGGAERLIVRGRANLLDGTASAEDLERIRTLFDDLERKRDLVQLLDLTEAGEGVRVFIGSENKLFSLSGSSLVISPYMNAERRIVGAIGVI